MNIQQAIRFIGLLGLLVCLFFSQSCRKKQDPNPSQAPTVGITTVSNVTHNSAALASAIKTTGFNTATKSPISEYGFVYGQTDNPTDNKVKAGTATEQPVDFTGQLTGLTPGSKYFVRSYVVYTLENQAETAYGQQATFTTQNLKAPDVSTNDATDLTTNAFSIAGKLTALGTSDVVQTGHVLSATNQTPTLADTKTETGGSNSVPKEFKSTFTNLQPNTTYYVRAYATNATGTGYGDVKTIKTANLVAPTATTGNVSNITTSSADVGVTRNTLGTTTNGQVGICWSSTNQNPTIADTKRENGSSNAPEFFTINLTNLNPNTTYYVRGYATTAAGTGYGDVKSFKTNLIVPTVETTPNPTFNTSPNLESNDARITLLGMVVTKGVSILEYGFVVHNSKTPNPTVENAILKVLSNSSISSTNGAVIGGEIKKADIEKLEATNNFRAYIKTADGVYYGSNQTFSYTYPPEFSSLKFDCYGTSFFVTKYSRTPQITEIGEIEVFSTNYTLVTPLKLPNSAGYTEKQYFNIPTADASYSLYVFNTSGKLISLLPSANGKVYTTNAKIESGSLQRVCWSYPWKLVIPYAKMANGTVYYPNPPSIKPVEKCFIDCTVK